MTERLVIFVQTCIAFDNDCNRAPQFDGGFIEDLGVMPSEFAADFGRRRYPKAIQVVRLTPIEIEAMDKHWTPKFDPEAGCHPLK